MAAGAAAGTALVAGTVVAVPGGVPGVQGGMVDPGYAHHTRVDECIYGVSY